MAHGLSSRLLILTRSLTTHSMQLRRLCQGLHLRQVSGGSRSFSLPRLTLPRSLRSSYPHFPCIKRSFGPEASLPLSRLSSRPLFSASCPRAPSSYCPSHPQHRTTTVQSPSFRLLCVPLPARSYLEPLTPAGPRLTLPLSLGLMNFHLAAQATCRTSTSSQRAVKRPKSRSRP